MSYMGIASSEEKNDLAAQLAFLYLEKSDISGLTPKELAEKYFEVKQEIYTVVSPRGKL